MIPGDDLPDAAFLELIYFDKWVHIGLFAILCLLWCVPLLKSASAGIFLFLSIGGACLLYGVGMEYAQAYLATDRSFSVSDMLADAGGCIAGAAAAQYLLKRRRQKSIA